MTLVVSKHVLSDLGLVKGWTFSFLVLCCAVDALNRKLSLPVSRMWQWWVTRFELAGPHDQIGELICMRGSQKRPCGFAPLLKNSRYSETDPTSVVRGSFAVCPGIDHSGLARGRAKVDIRGRRHRNFSRPSADVDVVIGLVFPLREELPMNNG